jgi:hypothetical protein
MVPYLMLLRDDLPKGSILVPATLHRLLMGQASPELAELLTIAVLPRDATEREVSELEITTDRLGTVMAAYRHLVESKVVREISDEDVSDRRILELLDSLASRIANTPSVTMQGGTRMTPRKLVRKHIGTMVAHSRKTGTAILASGRSLASRFRGKIPILELPHEVTNLRLRKRELKRRYLVKTENAETVQYAAALALGVAAFVVAPPAGLIVAGGSFVLVILDP